MTHFPTNPIPLQPTFQKAIAIRPAAEADLPVILELIHQKAVFDGEPDAVEATLAQLQRDLFGESPLAAVLLAEYEGTAIGFATYHPIYSTFLARPGIWLDDLYLQPEFRGQGTGTRLMQHLCSIAQAQGCGRIDWTVNRDNHPAIAFYRGVGAEVMESLRLCRLDQNAIAQICKVSEEAADR